MSIEEGKIFFIIIKAFWGDALQTAPALPLCSHKPISKSFRPPFSKGGAGGGRGALLALCGARILLTPFSFLITFSFAALASKEKVAEELEETKGKPSDAFPFFLSIPLTKKQGCAIMKLPHRAVSAPHTTHKMILTRKHW